MPTQLSSSSILDRYLEQLKKLRATHSAEAVSRPKERTEFEYGKVCGVDEGFARAEKLLADTITQSRANDEDD